MTKIDIFSGFLGAGKTTLIKKLITEAYIGEKLVLIENEFGEIGIDGGFMKEAGIQVNEMNSGCICCSLVGDFTTALAQVIEQFAPDRILIEPSGVGKLSDVIKAAQQAESKGVKLNSFTSVVDVSKCKVYSKNFGEFYNDQLANAGCIIFSRTDGIAKEKIDAALALVREKNAAATIITTPWDQLSGAQILSAMEQRHTVQSTLEEMANDACPVCGHHHDEHHDHDEHHHHDEECHCDHHHHDEHHGHDEHLHHDDHHHHDGECHCHDHHHHHADDVFTSWGTETVNAYTMDEISAILSIFDDGERCGSVLRAKGIVAGADGQWVHFDYVPGEADVRFGCADVIGKICVIGASLNEAEIKTLFRV